jgi:predicted outer membrane repeat protein
VRQSLDLPFGGRERLARGLLVVGFLMTLSGPATTQAATPGCRVRNVTQETSGASLVRIVRSARDGDRIRIRGTCRGEIVIGADITIEGRGASPTLTGRDQTRVVKVRRGAAVTLRDLTIQHGTGVIFGAGISNRGALTLRATRVSDNHTYRQWGMGGGIANWGTLRLIDSEVRRNRARRNGGGIMNRGRLAILRRSIVAGNATTEQQNDPYGGGGIENSGRLRLVDSMLLRNRSLDNGGGLYSWHGQVTVVRSTIARNRSAASGGGIQSEGRLTVSDSTVRDNTSSLFGGGISTSRAELTETTVSGNSAYRGGGISGGSLTLVGTTVTGNTAESDGGGIYADDSGQQSTVTLDAGSSVMGNVPDDCVGTPAC